MKPEIDRDDYLRSVNVKMNDVEIGDIIYEKGHQIVVLSSPKCEKSEQGEQWFFDGLVNQRVHSFITTVDSPYKLQLTWEPMFTPMVRVDGSIKNMGGRVDSVRLERETMNKPLNVVPATVTGDVK